MRKSEYREQQSVVNAKSPRQCSASWEIMLFTVMLRDQRSKGGWLPDSNVQIGRPIGRS